MKKLWEKIKTFVLKIWALIKAWFIKTAVPWLKKNWMQVVNMLVLFIAYHNLDSMPGLQTIIGLWLFVLIGYYIFWKLLGVDKLWAKIMEDRKKRKGFDPQPEPPGKDEPITPVTPVTPVNPEVIDTDTPLVETKSARKPRAKKV
jgi:hypothetical protein